MEDLIPDQIRVQVIRASNEIVVDTTFDLVVARPELKYRPSAIVSSIEGLDGVEKMMMGRYYLILQVGALFRLRDIAHRVVDILEDSLATPARAAGIDVHVVLND